MAPTCQALRSSTAESVSGREGRRRPSGCRPGRSPRYGELLPLLAEKYRTFAPDNLGAGNSDPLPPGVQIADLARSMAHHLQIRDVAEIYRAIFAFDLGARMRQIRARTLIIEVATPQEDHLGRQGEKLEKLVPDSRLVTVEHTTGGMVVEAEARELARLILGFLSE